MGAAGERQRGQRAREQKNKKRGEGFHRGRSLSASGPARKAADQSSLASMYCAGFGEVLMGGRASPVAGER